MLRRPNCLALGICCTILHYTLESFILLSWKEDDSEDDAKSVILIHFIFKKISDLRRSMKMPFGSLPCHGSMRGDVTQVLLANVFHEASSIPETCFFRTFRASLKKPCRLPFVVQTTLDTWFDFWTIKRLRRTLQWGPREILQQWPFCSGSAKMAGILCCLQVLN